MRSGILRCRIAALRLNPRAPFPSQIRARQNYVMRGLRRVKPLSGF
jgi:hypothetical protein